MGRASTQLLFDTVADLSEADGGFFEGLYENGNGVIPLQTANNNGIILTALLYKVQGPILQFANPNTSVWDMAYSQTDIRANKCLPEPMRAGSCCLRRSPPPVPTIAAADFILCRPVRGAGRTLRDRLPPAPGAAEARTARRAAASVPHRRGAAMTTGRMLWFDANRVCAARGRVC